MKQAADFLVEKRLWWFIGSVIVSIVCVILMNFVTVNEDCVKIVTLHKLLDFNDSLFKFTLGDSDFSHFN